MNTTCTFDILHQRQSSVWIRRSWCWTQYFPQSWQSQACFLGSDCQLKNLLVIGPQNIGRLPVVTAPTVNVHLISAELTHTQVVCCYLQPKPQSEPVPLYTPLIRGGGRNWLSPLCGPLLQRITCCLNYRQRERPIEMLHSQGWILTQITQSKSHTNVKCT